MNGNLENVAKLLTVLAYITLIISVYTAYQRMRMAALLETHLGRLAARVRQIKAISARNPIILAVLCIIWIVYRF